jgi:hypothetical protein
MTEIYTDMPPEPPIRNESKRTFFTSNLNSLSTSTSTTSASISSTNSSSTPGHNGTSPCSMHLISNKPLPKTPDEEPSSSSSQETPKRGGKKESKTKYLLSQSIQSLQSLFTKKLSISSPINFNHEVHVIFNSASGDFEGMPEEWKVTLQNSSISAQEQKENPQAVLIALDFFHHQKQINLSSKFMYSSEKNISLTPPPQQQYNNSNDINVTLKTTHHHNSMRNHQTNSSSDTCSLNGKSDEDLNSNSKNTKQYLNNIPSIPYSQTVPVINQQLNNKFNNNNNDTTSDNVLLSNYSTPKLTKFYNGQNQNLNLSPAMYQYDYNIKSAKFHDNNIFKNDLFSSNFNQFKSNNNTIECNSILAKQLNTNINSNNLIPPPPVANRPEKTKSIVS